MTEPRQKPLRAEGKGSAGNLRVSLAMGVMIAILSFGTAVTALAGTGGVGSGSDGGGGDGGGDDAGNKYDRAWSNFSERNKKWARKTSECESGGDPNIHGSGGLYHGAFQFHADTWRTSPMSPGGKHADAYNWKTQAVVAVKLKQRDGAGHWPVCG